MALYLGSKMVSALSGAAGGSSANPVLEELTATENKEYTPGEGVDGFSKVVVNVESPIDLESLIAVCDAINGEAVDGESVEAKVSRLMNTKEDIKAALIEKGQTVTDADAFSSYADKIRAIKGTSKLEALTVTENGTYIPGEGIDGYSSVTVAIEGATGWGGTLTDTLSWELGTTGTLAIVGTGAMPDYTTEYQPWLVHKDIIKDIIILDGVTHIGKCAFYNYTNLETVTIPESVNSFGYDAFNKCENMTGVYISNILSWCRNEFDQVGSNPLYRAHNLYLNGELVENLTIPQNASSIASLAFLGCTSLVSVVVPDSVTTIGAQAFSGCLNLEDVTLSKKLNRLEMGTFLQCAKIKDLVIPDSVKSIGQHIFMSNGLESVTIGSGVTRIEQSAFTNSLTSATFKVTGGWSCTKSGTSASISANDLADASTAAIYLGNTYRTHEWTRT